MSALSVKFMLFNDISHWIFSPRELVHEAEITYRAIFSLVDSKIIIKKSVYMCNAVAQDGVLIEWNLVKIC